MRIRLTPFLFALSLLALAKPALAMKAQTLSAADEKRIGQMYQDRCSHCHGVKGGGDGYAVTVTRPVPRDFTSCAFKFRRTTGDMLPTVEDLYLSITNGMPGTSMPAWGGDGVFIKEEMIPEADRWLLAKYITRFCDDMSNPDTEEPVKATWPTIPEPTPEVLAHGKEVFEKTCSPCHGKAGRGNGPQAPIQHFDVMPQVKEALGIQEDSVPIWPRNLNKPWTFRNGSSADDIYRTITTGLMGSPMLSFKDNLSDDDRIAIASYIKWKLHYPDYIRDLKSRKEGVVAQGTTKKIPIDALSKEGMAFWSKTEESAFPLIAQVIAPPRKFWTSNDLVWVRAAYTKDRVGIYVKWDDPTGPYLDMDLPTDKKAGDVVVLPVGGEVTRGEKINFKAYQFDGKKFNEVQAAWSIDKDIATIDASGAFAAGDMTGSVAIKATVDGKDVTAPLMVLDDDFLQVQVPTQFYEGVEKPHFLNGDPNKPVHLWQVNGSHPDALQIIKSLGHMAESDPKVQTVLEGAEKDYEVHAAYKDGQWHVVITRPLIIASEDEPQIPIKSPEMALKDGEQPRFVPIAFDTGDGNQGDHGMQKNISVWYGLFLKPPPDESAKVTGLAGFGITFVILLFITFIVKRAKTIERRQLAGAEKGEG